jgi:Ca-activated chloride channel homolog
MKLTALLGSVLLLSATGAANREEAIAITSPGPDTIVSGAARLAAIVSPEGSVRSVSFYVNGRLVCTAEHPPFGCAWDPGAVVRSHHVRVVAAFASGRRLVANVRTKDLGYTERTRVEAVLVPVIVTSRGRFVRGLKKQDFEVFENGVAQSVSAFANEDTPLNLVFAIDISGSMDGALGDVKPAVRQLLAKLRPTDAVTLLGFNDTPFIVAERERDPATRENAVELLTSWGGTALYDATVRALDMVSREWGRKGVILFSDGDDRHSLTRRETATARVQASDAMLYTIGFGAGATVPTLRSSLENYAGSTGGRAFFPRESSQLDSVFTDIVSELSNQYVLAYVPTDTRRDGTWREIKVRVRSGKYDVRARLGYRAEGTRRAGR